LDREEGGGWTVNDKSREEISKTIDHIKCQIIANLPLTPEYVRPYFREKWEYLLDCLVERELRVMREFEEGFYEQHSDALNAEDSERFVRELIKTDEARERNTRTG